MQTEVVSHYFGLQFSSLAALAITLVTAFALVFGRYEIRLRRLRLIRDYVKAFPVSHPTEGGPESTNPSFEFVRSKYAADIRGNGEITGDDPTVSGPQSSEAIIKEINETIGQTRFFLNRGDARLLVASLPYLLIVFVGFSLTLSGTTCPEAANVCLARFSHNLLTVGGVTFGADGSAEQFRKLAENVLTIAVITFVGAYLSSLRYLVQALAVFDLSGYTVIRHCPPSAPLRQMTGN